MTTPYRVHLTPAQQAKMAAPGAGAGACARRARPAGEAPALRPEPERITECAGPRQARVDGAQVPQGVPRGRSGGARQWRGHPLPDRPHPGRPATLTETHLLALERLLDKAATRGERTRTAPRWPTGWPRRTSSTARPSTWASAYPSGSSAGTGPHARSSTRPLPTTRHARRPTGQF